MSKYRLALFDLDNTLLAGDSDVLWCEFLMAKGVLEREAFAARNADMEQRYREGTVGTREFAHFYLGLLAGKTPAHWEPLRQEFLVSQVVPRIPPAAVALVDKHIDAGDLVIMTTATSRFITELTAVYFGIEHLLAIEPEIVDGVFTGGSTRILNMRSGKVERLHQWLVHPEHAQRQGRAAAPVAGLAQPRPREVPQHRLQRLDQRPAAARSGGRAGRGRSRPAPRRHRAAARLAGAAAALRRAAHSTAATRSSSTVAFLGH
ncbi:MAG: HAD family hydrolase [Ramlibacter sp.]